MTKALIILLGSFMVSFCETSPTVAILNFEYDLSNDKLRDKSYSICEEVKHQLINSGKLIVVERAKISKILNEQKIVEIGLCDKDCYVRIGKLTGAKYLLFGVVSVGDVYLRVIDGNTGQIIKSFSLFECGKKINKLSKAVITFLSKG